MGVEVTDRYDLLDKDLAGTYRRTASAGASVDPEVVAADLTALERDGYVILPDLLSAAQLDEIRASVTPLLDQTGRNGFEGRATQRVYSVLNKTRACDRIVDHPRVLALLDRLFMPNYLLSMLQVINIEPGEQAQMLFEPGPPGQLDRVSRLQGRRQPARPPPAHQPQAAPSPRHHRLGNNPGLAMPAHADQQGFTGPFHGLCRVTSFHAGNPAPSRDSARGRRPISRAP